MKKILPIIVALVFALSMPAAAFAEGGNGSGGGGGNGGGGGGGNGSGGGNGGGASEPLVVTSTSVGDAAEIAPDETITLVFSKNVCDAGVREANRALVTVKDAQGNDVHATVTLADDQVEPAKKNDIVVGFEKAPEAGSYTLTAKAGITSKSGDVLEQDYVLAFKVAASAASSDAASSASSASASASSASASASSSSASASSASASSSSSSDAPAQQSGPDATLFIIIGVIVVAAVAGVAVYFKRKK